MASSKHARIAVVVVTLSGCATSKDFGTGADNTPPEEPPSAAPDASIPNEEALDAGAPDAANEPPDGGQDASTEPACAPPETGSSCGQMVHPENCCPDKPPSDVAGIIVDENGDAIVSVGLELCQAIIDPVACAPLGPYLCDGAVWAQSDPSGMFDFAESGMTACHYVLVVRPDEFTFLEVVGSNGVYDTLDPLPNDTLEVGTVTCTGELLNGATCSFARPR